MPPRDPELPEGTDHIVTGAGEPSRGPAATGGPSTTNRTTGETGFVATGGGNDTGGTASRSGKSGGSVVDTVKDQFKDQATTLRDQAADKLRTYADDGKSRATGLLDEFCGVLNDAAKSIDERLGSEYGEYAHKAAGQVSSWNAKLRDKSVDEMLDDTRSIVRKSPAIAIGTAAVLGFALMRVVKTGLEDMGNGRNRGGGGRTNAPATPGTKTGGGA